MYIILYEHHCSALFMTFYTFRRSPSRPRTSDNIICSVHDVACIIIIISYTGCSQCYGHTCGCALCRIRIPTFFTLSRYTPAQCATAVSTNAETGLPRRTEFNRGGDLLTQFFCGPFFRTPLPPPTPPPRAHNATTMRTL